MNKLVFALLFLLAMAAFPAAAKAQVDDLCREFGVMPSLDSPFAQVPYVYGKINLKGFNAGQHRVTITFADRDITKRISVSKSGNYCFRRTGSGGSLVVEVDGIEVARRTLPGFGAAQVREDFDIYPQAPGNAAPGTVSAKFAHPRNEKTVELYEKAAKAEREKQLDTAIVYVKGIVAIDPADFVAWSILGSLYLEQKSFEESDAAFRKSLALKVEYTPAWINVGRLRIAQKQPEAAIEIFKHAASLDATSARIFKHLGEAYLQTKQGTLGVAALNEAVKLDPIGMADCHLLIARLYDLAGAKHLAAREYKMFLEKVPDYADKAKLAKYIKENPE